MMRSLPLVVLLVVLVADTQSAALTSPSPDFILPGVGMGPVRIGMPVAAAENARRQMVCGYAVTIFAHDGLVSRVETNCGGALQTPDGIQAGSTITEVLAAHGKPDAVVKDEVYEHGTAYWFNYRSGIGFRAVVFGPTPDHTVITTIAVWKPQAHYNGR